MSFEERDYLRTFSKRRGPPFYRRFYASRRNKVEEPRRGAPNESNEAQPNYRRQGLSRYLLQIGSSPPPFPPPPPPPRCPRSAFHVEERAPLSRESLFIGNRSYSNPPRFLPRTRTDANFFFQSIENRGPEKGFIWHDAIARNVVVPRQTEESFLIGKQSARDSELQEYFVNHRFVRSI